MAEAKLTFTPENPMAGEYVDATVTPDREGAVGVRYELSTPDGFVYQSKDKDVSGHFTASFRPREEAVYTLTAVIVYSKKDSESVSVTIPVSGVAPAQEGSGVVYSQKDGWWHDKVYSKKHHRSLEKAGCAIFTLSHILQRIGITGEGIQPDKLALKYSFLYIEGRGTDNEGLLVRAGDEYGFLTQADLIETERGIATCLKRGDLFSFSIVLGHIAMADGISEDGTKVHVVDSAPGATYERKDRFKTKGHVYYQEADGSFTEAVTPDQLPGIRWFFETGEYGGMDYWLDLHYCAVKGMRLVRRPWLKADTGSGLKPVSSLEYAGAMVCKVKTDGEAVRVPTKDLVWSGENGDTPQIAVISKKNTKLLDGDGKALAAFKNPLAQGTMLLVLGTEDDLVYVYWKDVFCYVSRKNVDLIPVVQETFSSGVVSVNGKTAGSTKVTIRNTPSGKGKSIAEWTIGTPVAVIEPGSDYTLVEGKGSRGWIPNKYLTLDAAE